MDEEFAGEEIEEFRFKKQQELDYGKQKEFKRLAKDLIGDYSILEEGDEIDSIPLLAGYD